MMFVKLTSRSSALILCSLLSVIVMSACVEAPIPLNPLMVSEVRPPSAISGSGISLIGVGFGIQGVEDQVTLSGETLEVLYWSARRIDLRIPVKMTSGAKWLVVNAGTRVSHAVEFDVIDSPRYITNQDAGDPARDSLLDARLNDGDTLDITSDSTIDLNIPPDLSSALDQGLSP